MGGKSSKSDSPRYSFNYDTSYGYASQSDLGSSSSSYPRSYADYERRSKLQSRYKRIGDDYHSLEQVLCLWNSMKKIFACIFLSLLPGHSDNWKIWNAYAV